MAVKLCQRAGCREPATNWVQLWMYYVGYLCAAHTAEADRLGMETRPMSEEDMEGGS